MLQALIGNAPSFLTIRPLNFNFLADFLKPFGKNEWVSKKRGKFGFAVSVLWLKK